MTEADSCNTMAELRVLIDHLDVQLIALLQRRVACIDRAALLKPAAGLPARIDDRVEQVVANVRDLATGRGLDPVLVERLWRILIDWSIAREERAMAADIRSDGA